MTRRVRVLHAHSGNLFGGIETIMLTLARTPADVEHVFALSFTGRLATELDQAGAAVVPLPAVRFGRPWTVWRARRGLRAVVAARSPDAVLCHSPWAMAAFAPAVRAGGVPLVYWMHGVASGKHWVERLARRYRPDLVVCNSRFTRESLDVLYPGIGSEVVYAPVPAPVATPAGERDRLRRELGASPNTMVITQVSRMEPGKGHRVLLDALARLEAEAEWQCWLVGGAQRDVERRYERELSDRARALGLESRVLFLGERRDVARILAASDLFCQPNVLPESFGVTVVEAMYAGVPVVASALGGGREIVTDACGVLVPPDDAEPLRDALAGLLADPDRRRRLGANGPKRARELCDPERQAARLREVLEWVLGVGC